MANLNPTTNRPEHRPELRTIADALSADMVTDTRMQHAHAEHLPDREALLNIAESLREIVFPGFYGMRRLREQDVANHVSTRLVAVEAALHEQIICGLSYGAAHPSITAPGVDLAADVTMAFLQRLPEVRRMLSLDVQAAYDGDPAARHTDEAILCYPGITALFVHRIAHELYSLRVPLIPRIWQEFAHAETGIDIHPGATIGESFFVDHGTGVVIGETTKIGDRCKVYQGVTLGARSFEKDERGQIKRGTKRHPTLGNDVTVYAGATVLGGDTHIGDGCVIAGSVFLTKSVDADHVAQAAAADIRVRPHHGLA